MAGITLTSSDIGFIGFFFASCIQSAVAMIETSGQTRIA